ncbi:MAG TPA: acyltransferase [Lysobacter sp.]
MRGTQTSPISAQHLSRTINLARISLIVGLVFLHYQTYPNSTASPFDGIDLAHHPWATYVNSFVLFFFFSAVPLLSMISGWLFFSAMTGSSAGGLQSKVRHRFRTLYAPMACWNVLFLVALALLYWRSPEHPLLDQLNLQFDTASGWDYLNAVFAVTQHPIGYQFWFVRDLFVTVLVSPLLLALLRRLPYLGLLGLGVAWLVGHDLWIFFRTDVVFFFYLGGLIGLRRIELNVAPGPALALMALYLVLVGLRAWAPAVVDMVERRPEWLTGGTRAMRLIGVAACWGVLLWLARTRLGARLAGYGGLAFFLFAMHFPLLAAIKWVLWQWVPVQTDAWMLAHYVSSVVVTIGLGLGAGWALSRCLPELFALMNGGRALAVPEPQHASAARPPTVAGLSQRRRST